MALPEDEKLKTLFDDSSEIYAKTRPRYPGALYEWVAGVCEQREKAWDAACGNGQAAADLRDYFQSVEASDSSSAQIAAAPPYERVNFSVQVAESTSFGNHSFDAVCVAQALHWFDFPQFWPEVRRVLKPGGIFLAWGYTWPRLSSELDEILASTLLKVIEPFWAPQNRLLWNRYQDVPLPFSPLQVPAFELCMKWSLDEFFFYIQSWSATRICLAEKGDDFFRKSYETMKIGWGNEGPRAVAMDFFVVAGRKEK